MGTVVRTTYGVTGLSGAGQLPQGADPGNGGQQRMHAPSTGRQPRQFQ